MVIFAPRYTGLGVRAWKHGLILGIIYGSAQVGQIFGLAHTDASICGFITGTYVVLAPIVAWALLKDKIPDSLGSWLGRHHWASRSCPYGQTKLAKQVCKNFMAIVEQAGGSTEYYNRVLNTSAVRCSDASSVCDV